MDSSLKKTILFLSFALLAAVFVLLSPNTSLAQTVYYSTECGEQFAIGSGSNVYCSTCCSEYSCWPCCPCCTQYSCSGSWTEYRASTSGCDPVIQVRQCQSVCSGPGSACCSCGGCKAECTPWETCEDCGSWHKAERSCEVTRSGLQKPEPICTGDCIAAPAGPRYYDNPDFPTNPYEPEESKNPNNIYLPVKLDWDDVKGWEKGWKEGDTYPITCSESCPECPGGSEACYEAPQCVHSYEIKITQKAVVVSGETIEEEKVMVEGKILDKSEYNILEEHDSCFLKSNRTYQWQVRGCCGAGGTECGTWSGPWEFTTNAAPEPKMPYDPDWNGPEKVEELPLEETGKLQWCKIEDQARYEEKTVGGERVYRPLSYNILIYYLDDDACHPQLSFGEQCVPQVLSPDEAIREVLPPEEFVDKDGIFFTKETPYAWKVAACRATRGFECTDYSQLWKLTTGDWTLSAILSQPPDNTVTPVGLPAVLGWISPGANSFNYEIFGVESDTINVANVTLDYPKLSLNTVYSWRVQPCLDYEGEDCEKEDCEEEECEDKWYGPWSFRTTGQPPQLGYPAGDNIPLPVRFEWEAVGGARSYVFKIQGPGLSMEETTEGTEFSLDYPSLKQETNYTWQVKTCARTGGSVCGEYGSPQSFRTFKLSSPASLAPQEGGEIYTYQSPYNVSWQPVQGAKYYQYEVIFTGANPEDPKAAECQSLLGQKIVSDPEDVIIRSSTSLPLSCWGDYQWQVRACLDENCEEGGDYSSLQNFSFVVKVAPPGERGGLVPCGREAYNPDTPWDETEKCQIKHLFVILFSLIDFFLWKVIPLVLVLLAVASGVIFYFSLQVQAPDPIAKVKSLWKTAGIGLGIIFFSWIIVSLFLTIFGYQVGIFGPWWQIF
jgi:hypothetical protein